MIDNTTHESHGYSSRLVPTPHVDIRRGGRRRNGAVTIGFHRHTICPATGKIRYRDSHQVAQALEGARRLRSAQLTHLGETSRHEQRSYRCDSCDGHHLSSQPKGWKHGTARIPSPSSSARSHRLVAIDKVLAACVADLIVQEPPLRPEHDSHALGKR